MSMVTIVIGFVLAAFTVGVTAYIMSLTKRAVAAEQYGARLWRDAAISRYEAQLKAAYDANTAICSSYARDMDTMQGLVTAAISCNTETFRLHAVDAYHNNDDCPSMLNRLDAVLTTLADAHPFLAKRRKWVKY